MSADSARADARGANRVEERKGELAPRVVLTGLAVSLVAALAVAYYIYARYVRFDATASRHVAPGVEVLVRVDVQQAVVYEPFRKHLLHLLEAGRQGPESRLLHLERKTTLELGVDTREVVFGWGPGVWSIAAGGLFRRDQVVEGVGRMLDDEHLAHRLLEGPRRIVMASGAAFGVTEDATLLVTSSDAALLGAFGQGPTHLTPEVGELVVLSALRPAGFPLGAGRKVERLRAGIRAGSDFSYKLELFYSGPPLSGGPAVWGNPAGGPWAALGALHAARVLEPRPGHYVAEGELSRTEFEELLARLAVQVRSAARLPI
jgi:hypothetical protein